MIDIRNIDETLLYTAPVTKDAVFRHELMSEEYVQLVFNEVSKIDVPIGCYIEYSNRKYLVTDLVFPELIDGGYKYSIRFEAEWMRWKYITYFYINEFTDKPEANWSLTATPELFLSQVTKNISRAIGQTYTFSYDASLTATKDLTFGNKTVLEALSMIAEAFETEWWVEGTVIHLSRCEHGEPVTLSYGDNISTPTASGESEYATRIYAYGSTRNITQDYQSGGTINALVEKRLTLPVAQYPNGYKDIKEGLSPSEIIEKTVIFDDIYPSSDFPISAVRMDPRLDTDTIVGTNEDGTPIYATFPVYYFKIAGIDFSEDLIIEGQTLKVHFLSGLLQGREFGLIYHKDSQEYEIVIDQESGAVKLPNETLMPQDDDIVVLFNIQMPDEYVTSAENRLAEALETYINEKILADTYTYSFASNPVAFAKESIALTVGRRVTLNHGFGTLSSRVLSVEYPLYAPSKMEVSVGGSTPKGKIETIETETVNASSQIEIIQAYNNATKTIQNQLNRATQIMAEGIVKLGNMWYIDKSQDTTGDKSDSSKWIVRTSYPVATDKTLSQLGPAGGGGGESGGGSGGGTYYHDQLLNLDYPDQHPIAAVTGLQTALDGKADAAALTGYLPLSGGDITDNLTIGGNQVWHAGNANRRETDWSAATLYLYGSMQYGSGKTELGRDTEGAYFNSMDADGRVISQLRLWNDRRITFMDKIDGKESFYDMWHAGNANLSTVNWTADTLNCNRVFAASNGTVIGSDSSEQSFVTPTILQGNSGTRGTGNVPNAGNFAFGIKTLCDNGEYAGFCFLDKDNNAKSFLRDYQGDWQIYVNRQVYIYGNLVVSGTITQLGG